MKKSTAMVAIAAAVLLAVWIGLGPPNKPAPVPAIEVPPTASAPVPNPPEMEATVVPPDIAPPPPGTTLATLSAEEVERVRDAIDNLEFAFRDHAAALGGNPVGTNAEITASLRGDNVRQLALEIPSGSTVNAKGELCDPWGTPWFFHQMSASKMEIRSAGPDHQLYSEDDFVR